MGTRSLTIINSNEWGKDEEICVLYRQFDGYVSVHGQELAKFLDGYTVTNGISRVTERTANGSHCLAAQIIAHFKTEVGNFYLYPAKTRDIGEEYIYEVTVNADYSVQIKVTESYEGIVIFEGSASQLLSFKED